MRTCFTSVIAMFLTLLDGLLRLGARNALTHEKQRAYTRICTAYPHVYACLFMHAPGMCAMLLSRAKMLNTNKTIRVKRGGVRTSFFFSVGTFDGEIWRSCPPCCSLQRHFAHAVVLNRASWVNLRLFCGPQTGLEGCFAPT